MALHVLADRAELWATIAPGLGHHLSNALMSLSLPGHREDLLRCAQSRIEKAHHVLHGMCETSRTRLPQGVAQILEDVEDWHQLQLGLPRCEVRMTVEPGLPGVADAQLHHALLAMLTLAKQEGATSIELTASTTGNRVALEVSAASAASGFGHATAWRQAVIAHLVESLGGTLQSSGAGASRIWRILLPAARASARPAGITSCSTAP